MSGTVAYAGRGRSASWDADARVDAGGLLVWDALPFVVADGADVERTMHVALADRGARGQGGVALLRETLVLGRTGEVGGRLRSRTRVELSTSPGTRVPRGAATTGESAAPDGSVTTWQSGPAQREEGRELFVEDLDLGEDRALPGILGAARVVDSVLCLGARPPAIDAPSGTSPAPTRRTGPPTPAGPLRLDLDGPGAIARHLGASTHDAGIDAVVTAWMTDARAARRAASPGDDARPGRAVPAGTVHRDHRTTLLTTGA